MIRGSGAEARHLGLDLWSLAKLINCWALVSLHIKGSIKSTYFIGLLWELYIYIYMYTKSLLHFTLSGTYLVPCKYLLIVVPGPVQPTHLPCSSLSKHTHPNTQTLLKNFAPAVPLHGVLFAQISIKLAPLSPPHFPSYVKGILTLREYPSMRIFWLLPTSLTLIYVFFYSSYYFIPYYTTHLICYITLSVFPTPSSRPAHLPVPSPACKLQKGRDFSLFCSLMYPKRLETVPGTWRRTFTKYLLQWKMEE